MLSANYLGYNPKTKKQRNLLCAQAGTTDAQESTLQMQK